MIFSTKAKTLETLAQMDIGAKILPQYRFTCSDWLASNAKIIETFFCSFKWATDSLVVRSSALSEDSSQESLAGHFDSVVNVCGKDDIKIAVNKVLESFGSNPDPLNQIFI
jgi:hypothetical protein